MAPMKRGLAAGSAYFAVVFALGFVLGVVRGSVVAPRLGEGGALALELPVMLAASWIACGRMIAMFNVPADRSARIVMGASAFTLLMAAETTLGVLGLGRTMLEHITVYRHPAALSGLAAQVAFAAFPLVRRNA
jgi:hypothetical protein